MRMRAPKEGSCDPIAPLELPHSLHAVHRVSPTDELNMVVQSTLPLRTLFFFWKSALKNCLKHFLVIILLIIRKLHLMPVQNPVVIAYLNPNTTFLLFQIKILRYYV